MRNRKYLIIITSLFVLLITAYKACTWLYPYGVRTACLPIMMNALALYSEDNNGWFPKGENTDLKSLQLIYPNYLGYGPHLAGLSGDREKVAKVLERNLSINSNISSWVYHPGLRQGDNPEIAIIWERKGGLRFNGRTAPPESHAVGFIDGSHKQVSGSEWKEFMERQDVLRKRVIRER